MLNFRKPRHTYENSIAHWVRVISPRKHGSSSEGLNEGVQGGRSGCPGSDWNLVQPQALVGGEQDSGKNHLIVIAFPAVLLPSNERLRLDGVPVTTWAPTTPTLNTVVYPIYCCKTYATLNPSSFIEKVGAKGVGGREVEQGGS